tara:strand:- start:940 stop:1722 length:783 start_codon:yes stop_codon:yes gene_type:complete
MAKIICYIFLFIIILHPAHLNAKENPYLNRLKKVFSGIYKVSLSSEYGEYIKNQNGIGLVKELTETRFIEFNQTSDLNSFDLTLGTNVFKNKIDLLGYKFGIAYQGSIIRESKKEIIFDSLDRLSFVNQIIIDYDLAPNLKIKLTPRFLHQNLADTKLDPEAKGYPWDMWFVGASIDWNISDNLKSNFELFNQMSGNDISTGLKSGFSFDLEYIRNSRSYLFTLLNFSNLSKNSILNNLGVGDKNQLVFRIQFIQGFEIN